MRPPFPLLPGPLLPATLALLALGCGRSAGHGGSFSLDLFVDGALPVSIASFQVELLTSGRKYDCQTLASTCLNAAIRRDQLVTLTDSGGKDHPALLFPAQAQASDGGTQDVTVLATVGSDYILMIEALSTDSPPRLAGSSCKSLPEGIRPGANKLLAEPMKLYSPPLTCNPSWE